jgi:chromosomal replication initiator protein
LKSIWAESTDIIKEKVSQQNFDTWIRPIRISSIEENNIYLSVPNRFFKEWLVENYLPVINNALSGLMGTLVNINFVVTKGDVSAPEIPPQEKKNKTKKGPTARRLHPSLNPNYNFERFIVGPSNQFAHAAAVSVAEQPASSYNPLFIYGGVGLGKTHLINAIGLYSYAIHTNKSVLYVSAEQFMNELINSIRYDKMPNFREKFRKIDFLLIDDIQFIAGKERTQEEFFHTFNTLHDSGKQIVVTSDKFPKEIPNLEGRLRSRFEWGLIADIQPPEMETRIAIVEKKAYENNMNISSDVTHYVATVADSNIRELEGMLTRIAAYSSLTGREIDIDVVKEVVKNLLKQRKGKNITVDEIIKVAASKFNIKVSDIKSQKKNKNLILPRQITMYISRKLTNLSFPDIGTKVGGRDHSTVIYSTNKVKKIISQDAEVKKIIEELEEILQTKS